MERYDGFWSHVNAVDRGFLGNGMVVIQNLPPMLCVLPGVNVLAGLLDPGLKYLPPLSHQSLEWQMLQFWDVGWWLICSG